MVEAVVKIEISGTSDEVRRALRGLLAQPSIDDIQAKNQLHVTGKEIVPVAATDTSDTTSVEALINAVIEKKNSQSSEKSQYQIATEKLEESVKKERKPRETKKEVNKVEAPTPPPAETPSSEEPTLDNCRNWVKAIASAKTLEDAQSVVTGFGVAKVGDLPESKYVDFIAECKKVLESKEGELFE